MFNRSIVILKNQGIFGLAVALSVLVVVAFVIYPTAGILRRSLSEEAREIWLNLLGTRQTFTTIANTIRLGFLVGVAGTSVGLCLALAQVRTNFRYKTSLHAIAIIPIIAPPFSVAMSVISLFGRSGLISRELFGVRHDISGLDGLTLAISISFMPIAYLNFVGMLRSLDPSLEDAAADLGGGVWHRLRTVVFPLLAPGLANSFLLIFVSAISDLGNPILLGGDYDVLSSRIYLAVIGEFNFDKASVLSVMLLAPSLMVFSAQYFWLRNKRYVTITGRPVGKIRPIEVRSFAWPLYAIVVSIMALTVLVYGYIVVGAFTKVWNINFDPTFAHMRFILEGAGREALFDTVRLALIATPLSGFSGLVIAYVITKRDFRGRGLLDFASVLAVAIPGTMIGLGLLIGYNEPHLLGFIPKLHGTAAIVVLAFTVRCLPGVVRVAVGALNQLSDNIEEASVSLGATPVQTFRRVVLPLIRPAVFASLIWSFARSMTTLSPIVFLTSPKWRIMTAQILNEADQGRFGAAAAYSLVLVVVVLTAIGLMSISSGFRLYTDELSMGSADPGAMPR